VDQAIQKLHRHPRLARCLWYLQQVASAICGSASRRRRFQVERRNV